MALVKFIAVAVAAVIVVGAAGIALSYALFTRQIGDDVARLVAGAKPPAIVVSAAMIDPLPAPAQRYFRYAGVVRRPIPTIVRLSQKGRIRGSAADSWMALEADETYSIDPPAFVWRASMPTSEMPVVLGRDEYLGGEGSILMKMLSLVTVADEHSDELKAAGLMRYLNETMWFPSALLDPRVLITPIDDGTFRASLSDSGVAAEAIFHVDGDGKLTNFEARRYNSTTRTIEKWETPIASYGVFGGLNLPASGRAVWNLAGGEFAYIEIEITRIEYQ